MGRILKTELMKLKRYHILWAGVALMLLAVILTLFTTLAEDGTVWSYAFLSEQVIKTNMTMIFPMCITLITGYIINRELKNDTLKSLYTVPVSFRQLLTGKLVVAGLFSLLLGAVCAVFTAVGCLLVQMPGFTLMLAVQSLYQQTMVNLFLYIAVLPIIVATSRSQNGFLAGVIVAFVYGYSGLFAAGNHTLAQIYPITASLGLVGYRSYDAAVSWNFPLCLVSLASMVLLSAIMLAVGDEQEAPRPAKKSAGQAAPKKGW
ncbi:MAG: ABC transporter permease [Gemmiger sp.]|nr:ABC transporter permease [Gemmiger sp.]